MKGKGLNKKAGIIRSSVLLAAVCGMVLSGIYVGSLDSIEKPEVETITYSTYDFSYLKPLFADANPGAGASGILGIYFINHSAGNDYATVNDSSTLETWCTANNLGFINADDFTVDIAHSVSFDVVTRTRGNRTHAYNTDKFFHTDLNVTWTSSALSVGADTAMTRAVASRNETVDNFIWQNFYDDNSGSGFTIGKGSANVIDDVKFDALY
ncbi:MAG: hypothetical protein DRN81_04415 [Thermoproteota archaeon]|nr:MAG: hypothetical protein DRN81_04415 [Candidatus Korarchaeota archaeon]